MSYVDAGEPQKAWTLPNDHSIWVGCPAAAEQGLGDLSWTTPDLGELHFDGCAVQRSPASVRRRVEEYLEDIGEAAGELQLRAIVDAILEAANKCSCGAV